MPAEPTSQRTFVFVDGQNLFYEVKQISIAQKRWIRIASAFPASPTYANRRGINGTVWAPFDRSFYDRCLDGNNYRKAPGP